MLSKTTINKVSQDKQFIKKFTKQTFKKGEEVKIDQQRQFIMGSSDSRIKVLDIPTKQLQGHLIVQPTNYVQPFRKFNTEYHKKSLGPQHESIIKIKAPEQDQVISVMQTKFDQIEQAYEQKTKNFQIQAIIFDEYYTDRFTYIVKDLQTTKSILLRPFQSYDSHTFSNIACEVNIAEEISKITNKHLLKLVESYVIDNDDIKFDNPKTQVLEFQGVAASLAEIIKYRRENNWEWTEVEFNQLVYDLTSGLTALHQKDISHNDIRPENVFYSIQKKCYVIGQFAYATKKAAKGNLRNNRASKNYTSPEANTNEKYDFQKADVFSLGTILLCALFLTNPIDIDAVQKHFNRFRGLAGFRVISQMLKPQPQRLPLNQILKSFPNPIYENSKGMQNLIDSLRFKTKPKNKNQKLYKNASSEFFKRLGLWQDWRAQVDDIFESNHSLTSYQTAELYEEIALIDYCQDQLDQSTMNAKKAAKLFREMGEQAMKEGDLNLALKNYKHAVECSKYYVNPSDLDVAKSLICLSKAHGEKREQQFSTIILSQAKDLVIKQSSKQSILYSEMMIKQAELSKKFFKFEQALQKLGQALITAKRMQSINERSSKLCQGKIYTLMAECEILLVRRNNLSKEEQAQKLQHAQECLNKSKSIYQSLDDIDCHLQLAENTQILGSLAVQRNQFLQGKLCYQKSLQMRRWYQQNKNQSPFISEHGTTLSNLGRCERLMNTEKNQQIFDLSLKHQQQALGIFRKVYGSDHNYFSASVLKEMGELYDVMGEANKSNQCFKCARKIFDDLYGENSPYDQIGDLNKMLRN